MALSKVIGVYRLTQDGTQKEENCFIEGVVFARLAEVASQYLHKGSKIYVVAELKQDTWTDNEGKNRSKHSLKIDSFEMLDSKPNDGNSQQPQPKQYQKQVVNIDIDMDDNSEVPF